MLLITLIHQKLDAVAYANSRFGDANGATVLKDVDCTGSEQKLTDCRQTNNPPRCTPRTGDAGVYCNINCKCNTSPTYGVVRALPPARWSDKGPLIE